MANTRLEVIQINLYHSKTAAATLVATLAVKQTYIALIQEPWIHFNLVHESEQSWERNPRKTDCQGYKRDLERKLKQGSTNLNNEGELETAAEFLSNVIRESYEENCFLRQVNRATRLEWATSQDSLGQG